MTPPPRPPEKPEPEMCCNRGCCPCIFDYYWDALDRWKARVTELGHEPDALLEPPAPATRCQQAP